MQQPQAVDDEDEARRDEEEWDYRRNRALEVMAKGRAVMNLPDGYRGDGEAQLLASVPHWAGAGGLASAGAVLGGEERLAFAVYAHVAHEAIAAWESGKWDAHRAAAALMGIKDWSLGRHTSIALLMHYVRREGSERLRRWALRMLMDAFPNRRGRRAALWQQVVIVLAGGMPVATPEWRELVASL